MAEGEGGWWGGWLQQGYQAVKDKSAEAYEFIKRDLTEFSNVVQHDTACSIVATASAVRSKLAAEGSTETTEKVKKSLSNLLGVITDTLAPPPDKTIDCEVITLMATPAGTTEVYDSTKARLYCLQADPATYCNEPDGPPEQFEAWLPTCSLEDRKGEISELLVSSPSIRSLYTKMVPVAVAHSEFWQRYFYKVYQLDQEEARRVALKQRAEQVTHSEALGWEEEEEEDEFLGASSSSRLDFTPPGGTPPRPPQRLGPPDSGSLTPPTQVERVLEAGVAPGPQGVAADEEGGARVKEEALVRRMSAAGLGGQEETGATPPPEPRPAETDHAPKTPRPAPPRPDAGREEGPHDLRVFELNSDSGKSTPSNNGKKGSSTDISEDWEKDFDLDMTEEEVQQALSQVNASGQVDDDDWEAWD
ncbi:hypothetical protein COCON_G00000830 [Conger conger]|uniref:BSD domain-containing protein n=1 Tax=Conger conger TaxID=82655 RepID=A0A9Q1E163_CONCO|nr:hypothetical protein COCON_G00000830 [Conger conger]